MGLELFLCSKIALRVSSFITLISKLTLLYLKTSTRQNIWKSVKKLRVNWAGLGNSDICFCVLFAVAKVLFLSTMATHM